MTVVNGTTYKDETPQQVIQWLETSRERRQRIRIFLGDAKTGKCWMEEHDIIGFVGRSTGKIKVPLLIKNSRSFGGGSILDHCIVRIDTKDDNGAIQTVYRHPNFHQEEFSVHVTSFAAFVLNSKKEQHARFERAEQAERYVKFMKGERWAK